MAKQAELLFTIAPCADDQLTVNLRLSLQPFAEMKVQRSRMQVQVLLSSLQEAYVSATPVSDSGSEESFSATELESKLNKLLEDHRDISKEPWNCCPLVAFLDNNAPAPPCFSTSTFQLMKNKINTLDHANNESLKLVADLQEKYAQLALQVQTIMQTMQIQHPEQPQENVIRSSPVIENAPTAAKEQGFTSLDDTASSDNSDSSASAVMKNLPKLDLNASSNSLTGWDQISASASYAAPAGIAEGSPRPEIQNNNAHTPLAAGGARFNPAAPEFNPRLSVADPGMSSASSQSALSSSRDSLPTSPFLPQTSYINVAQGDQFNEVIAELIHSLSPHQAQMQYRDSVVALIQRNFRVALNCEALEVGLHRILCFLPDDPIKVSAVLCRNHSTKWHRIICDRLNLIAKRKAEEMAVEGYTYRNDRPDDSGDDSTGDHLIRNVVISNSKLSIQVQCNVDNCDVELSCNSRADICMLALLEEFSVLVGKNDLFKQSLMLIRAWWSYECAAYVGTSIKYYLSDYALCVMVCAIFNQHHARINTPLQAFAAFLAEYSAYDGTTSAISLVGIVPFKSATSNQPVLPPTLNPTLMASGTDRNSPTKSEYLLCNEVMERYWLLYCPPDPSNPEQQQLKILPALSSSSEDVQGVDLNGIMNANFNLDFIPHANAASELLRASSSDESANAPSLEETALSAHRQSCTRNLSKFDRSQFNIVDPFTCNNMMLERPSQNRILRLTKVFQSGATQMAAMLTAASQQPPADIRGLVKAFFPVSTMRFVEAIARPDMFNIDMAYVPPAMYAQMTRKISMKVPLEELARQMRYCNLMVESVISRSAVLDLVVEILTQKGPLPIGEVGKALAELTCITGLSSRLKEAYGGLKKFLEDFSSVVIIGTDHPFNPHIVLRSSLSAEHLALNDSGMFPTHIVLRMKKVTATSIRKGAFLNKPTPQPMGQQGIPQHQGYRQGMVGANPGIGMGGMMMDNRGGSMNMNMNNMRQDPRGMMPPAHSPPSHYGQQSIPPGQQQHYTAKILSNIHADAREREMSYGRAQQPTPPLPGQRANSFDRHSSGSTNSHSHSTMNSAGSTPAGSFNPYTLDVGGTFVSGPSSVASNSNDPFDDYLASSLQPSPAGSYHKLPYTGQQSSLQVQAPAQVDHYHQQQQQQQQQQRGYQSQDFGSAGGFEMQRARLDSHDQQRNRVPPPYPHPSPPGSSRAPIQQQQQQQQQQAQDHYHADAHGAFPPSQHRGDYGQQQQQVGRTASAAPLTYGHAPARTEFSPNSSHNNSFVIDSFFESSTAPLSDPFAAPGNNRQQTAVRPGIFPGSTTGIGASRDEAMQGAGVRTRVGSLLSGLREGTVELHEQGAGQGQGGSPQQGRDWDPFQAPQQDFLGGGADWRGQQSHLDRKY